MKQITPGFEWERWGKNKIFLRVPGCSDWKSVFRRWAWDNEHVEVELRKCDLRNPYDRDKGYIKMPYARIEEWDGGFILYGEVYTYSGNGVSFCNSIEGHQF